MVLLLVRRLSGALRVVIVAALLALGAVAVAAAPYAAMVIDARTGEVLHSRNADARLHPASLTKMMTLYIAFQAVEHGEISLDDMVRVTARAAAEPPSKLGLRAGQQIKLRYLIRAAAVKSANDAATAIGEAISGSEAAFARRMNRTAAALGMTRTRFKNANGLTETGHLSTARDMTTLGRHLFYDYPQYYNLFSRTRTDAGIREVSNTNRKLLAAYRGADGIKTGYTRAAGFNLVASAQRGGKRIIATVFGGRSSASRNARVAELLDMGFERAPARVAERRPQPPPYGAPGTAGRTIRLVTAIAKSPRPQPRPGAAAVAVAAAAPRAEPEPSGPRVVTRVSTSGGREWGINVGSFGTAYQAERVLLQTALMELGTLDEALRKVVVRAGAYDANFVGLSPDTAQLACQRLAARAVDCLVFGPG